MAALVASRLAGGVRRRPRWIASPAARSPAATRPSPRPPPPPSGRWTRSARPPRWRPPPGCWCRRPPGSWSGRWRRVRWPPRSRCRGSRRPCAGRRGRAGRSASARRRRAACSAAWAASSSARARAFWRNTSTALAMAPISPPASCEGTATAVSPAARRPIARVMPAIGPMMLRAIRKAREPAERQGEGDQSELDARARFTLAAVAVVISLTAASILARTAVPACSRAADAA